MAVAAATSPTTHHAQCDEGPWPQMAPMAAMAFWCAIACTALTAVIDRAVPAPHMRKV